MSEDQIHRIIEEIAADHIIPASDKQVVDLLLERFSLTDGNDRDDPFREHIAEYAQILQDPLWRGIDRDVVDEHVFQLRTEPLHPLGQLFDQIAVVVSEQDSYIDQCRFAGDVLVLRCGGQTRAQSVLNGLKAWALPDNAWVFVHDAARPCVEKDSVERLIAALQAPTIDGAILALPVTDTLKWVNSEGIVERTIDRSHCCRAQTPQVFYTDLIKKAYQQAKDEGFMATDDSQLFEKYIDEPIKAVTGDYSNIKITTQEDLA